MFFEMEECRADKNWTYFYRIKGFKNFSYQKSVNTKSCSSNPTFLQENHIYENQVNFWQNKIIWII